MISVIIPTCNRNELLSNCLNRLKPAIQNFNGNFYEVIVTDDSKECIAASLIKTKYPWVKWIEGSKKGPAANRNNGAKYANGEWLVFIDDDCLPGNDLINAYNNAINIYKETEVFEGCIKADREKQNFLEESPVNEKGGCLWSCNFMIATNLFQKLQGFDPAFPYAALEDVDFRYRINKINKKIEFIQNACVIHPWRIERNILSKTKKRFESTLYLLKKHPEIKNRINAGYFFRSSAINFKNAFKYAYKFKFRNLGKQFLISIYHLYFAVFLYFKTDNC